MFSSARGLESPRGKRYTYRTVVFSFVCTVHVLWMLAFLRCLLSSPSCEDLTLDCECHLRRLQLRVIEPCRESVALFLYRPKVCDS